ncbi:MAG: hypothetical protein CTY22_10575 [Methylomonas sp.]|nr:MAG: hypothetical protein CTY22_10575 [Methylomonas sp.]PPD33490.1 MAG: hypothetical protein CTY21_10555 [Methylomonas sp.]PPD38393.1 MAG: hypothetical protein CTY17_09515 [Methylomonas sp.]PPD53803.1 MAG: hypothetical protein CTY11_05230 [Methylomonas sp.]
MRLFYRVDDGVKAAVIIQRKPSPSPQPLFRRERGFCSLPQGRAKRGAKPVFLVPTLCVGMQTGTLCVPNPYATQRVETRQATGF